MGHPNLEIFKFAMYLFIPVGALLHFGDPVWYRETVLPYREKLFPAFEKTHQDLPSDALTVQRELSRIKAEKLLRRQQREATEQES